MTGKFWPRGLIHYTSPVNRDDRWVLQRFADSLRTHGPLGTVRSVFTAIQKRSGRLPGYRRLFISIDRLLWILQRYLDSAFDRKYGIDTTGFISLKDLTVESNDVEDDHWYEPMSVKVFKQIMSHLNINNFGEFEFIDFGSGKGRILILASEYGFRKVIGVEFAQELHRIANENIIKYERCIQKPSRIETLCVDAIEFQIPNVPVVLFFYSPFEGKVMKQVLDNMVTSFAKSKREIILIFYGRNPETIKLLKATKFKYRELELSTDWSHFTKYRGILLTSPVLK